MARLLGLNQKYGDYVTESFIDCLYINTGFDPKLILVNHTLYT